MTQNLKIVWRNESFGHFSGMHAAFRIYDTGDLDTETIRTIHDSARHAGFTYSTSRASWIGEDIEVANAFVARLKDAGINVTHAGRWPKGPSS